MTRQARELRIGRDSVYYLPQPTSDAALAIMRHIDELHMDFPFAGSRMLRDLLAPEGVRVGRLHVSRLMKKMAHGFVYLIAIVDWFSRGVLACSRRIGQRSQLINPIYRSPFCR